MSKLFTSNGVEIIISPEDFDSLSQRKWCVSSSGYAVANFLGKVRYMHRIITSAGKGEQVDHINRDKLDNRRENLRIVNSGTNGRNKQVVDAGVTWRGGNHNSWCARFRIRVGVKLKSLCLGYYKDKSQAEKAHEKYRGRCIFLQLKGLSQEDVFATLLAERCQERREKQTRGWRKWS